MKREEKDPLEGLDARRRAYLENRVNGESKKEAAMNAGFSESMAENAKEKIETPQLQALFADLIQQKIPAEKIAQRIAEGLDAVETKFFSHEGVLMDFMDVIAWTERREYARLAAEYGKYSERSKKIELEGEFPDGCKVTVEFIGETPSGETPVAPI